jgi:Ala-tRNA(Pro) deacylase
MAVVGRLREFLDGQGIKYTVISHSKAYTAQELAASTHIRGKELAKTVVLKVGRDFVLVVVPAHHHVALDALSRKLGSEVRLASEEEFQSLFPGCEVGAMPPLGNLYGLKVYAADNLARDEEIVFNAGTHTDAVRMRFADFARLVAPSLGPWSQVAVYPPRAQPTA